MKYPQVLNLILAASLLALIIKTSFLNTSSKDDGKKDAIENIHQRKSVRQYKDLPVEEDKIDILLRAGMAAPSGRDIRPWQFVVVEDRETLDAMGDLPYAKMLKQANLAIVVCGDSTMSSYWYLDCSAATQNILLAAEALDLGAVWTAAYPYQDRMAVIRQNLNIPDSIQPLCVIPIGYPLEKQQPKDKYDEKVIHWGEY